MEHPTEAVTAQDSVVSMGLHQKPLEPSVKSGIPVCLTNAMTISRYCCTLPPYIKVYRNSGIRNDQSNLGMQCPDLIAPRT